jgi:hypothetical protein
MAALERISCWITSGSATILPEPFECYLGISDPGADMAKMHAPKDGFNWGLLFCGAAGAPLLFVPVMVYGNDIGEMLYIFIAAPIACFILLFIALVFANRKKKLRALAVMLMVVVYAATTWGLFVYSGEHRWKIRWVLSSREYKAEVMAQPRTTKGDLKHVEWDGWGGFGAVDTVAYLVYDPDDSLSAITRSDSPGKLAGIPCPVAQVRRFESHYYSVTFYTDTDWDHCN